MIRTELAAAGIDEPRLRDAYRRCRQINAAYGPTFFLAARLLAPDQRPPVHALYGFARHTDNILDSLNPHLDADLRAHRLRHLFDRFFAGGCHATDPVLAAVSDTVRRFNIDVNLFESFQASMRMDLTVTDYPDREALHVYMRGTSESLALQVLSVLGTVVPTEELEPYATAMGRALQLTNFIRNVDDDLARNRIYLPADELAAHGVDRELLMWCHLTRCTDTRARNALIAQHEIARRTYRFAAHGIGMLAPRSRPAVATALTLYSELLDRIKDSEFAIFSRPATVGMARRIRVAGAGLVEAWRTRTSAAAVYADYRDT